VKQNEFIDIFTMAQLVTAISRQLRTILRP